MRLPIIPMNRRVLIGIGITGAVFLLLAAIKYWQISSMMAAHAGRKPPPQAVTSASAIAEEWPRTFSAVGSLSAVKGAMLSAEEGGRVDEIFFESGSEVAAGTVLLALNVNVEKAQLQGMRAQLQLAAMNLKRQQVLREKRVNSQSALDEAESTAQNLHAEVARLEAIIEKKKVVAPFAGRTGIRTVNVGQFVQVGTPIVELTTLDPLFVDFTLPQQTLGALHVGQAVEVHSDAFPNSPFPGTLTALGSAVDPVTRNVKLQATISNTAGVLQPGMFVQVELTLDAIDKVVTIPASSVSYAPYGNFVYVITPGNAGEEREVTAQAVQLGERRGDRIAVLSGIRAGDDVVSSGTFKLYPGVRVLVNNIVTPRNELLSNPPDA